MKTHALVGLIVALAAACADDPIDLNPNPDRDGGIAKDTGLSDAGTPVSRITYEFLGLEGVDIEEVHLVGDRLFAVTRSGLYHRSIQQGAAWSGPAFGSTEAMVHLGGDELLLSVRSSPPQLHRSTDLGDTWAPVTEPFGAPDPETVFDFERIGTDVLATGTGVLARSTDGGRKWTPIFGDFGLLATGLSDVHVDARDDEIWVGGQGAIENVVFARSKDQGVNWDEWPNLIGPPSVLKDVGFHPDNTSIVFAGFEEGLMRTKDDGTHWDLVIDRHEDAKFFFGVEIDRAIASTVYAGGWLKRFADPQPMVLHISDDGGDTWTDFTGPAAFGGIWDMIQLDRPASEPAELIVGLQGGGVYRIRIARP